jgi:methyl-accepting chemotaxis protein
MKINEFSIKARIVTLIMALVIGQVALISVAVDRSHSLLQNLTNVTQVELPASRHLTLADMMHDGIRAVVLEALYDFEIKALDEIPEVEKEAKEKRDLMVETFESLKKVPLSQARMQELASASEMVAQYGDSSLAVIESIKGGDRAKIVDSKKSFDEVFEKVETLLGDLGEKIQKEATSSGDSGKNIVQSVLLFSLVSLVFSLALSVFIYAWTRKSFAAIVEKLSLGSSQINSLANVLSQESNKVRESSLEQAASIQESVSALSEMSSMIAQTGENIKLSLDTSRGAQERAGEGKQIMARMSRSMEDIHKANERLQDIGKVISDINSKTAVINDIVFKTQLLSFNASIEAARAGQHGRGFAVVAEEVGNLAELSGTAAREIESLLEESNRKVKDTLELIQVRVGEGNRVSHSALEAFTGISKNIEEINHQVQSINDATQQQEIGVQQSSTAMKQMDASSQINSTASNQAFTTSENLKSQAEDLKNVIVDLSQLISGASARNIGSKIVSARETKSPAVVLSPRMNSEPSSGDLEAVAMRVSAKKATDLSIERSGKKDQFTADDPDFGEAA